MKIFTMYYDRFKTATTSKSLHTDHIVLCHDNAKKFECIGKKGTIIETGKPKGIQHNFNFGLEELKEGEWGIFLSDDFKKAYRLNKSKFSQTTIMDVLGELIEYTNKAEEIGVDLIGLNATGNAFYAKKKFGKYGLIDGRCFAIRKTKFRYHEKISTIPDYYATAWHKKHNGGNLILNQIYLDFERYKKGGLGSVEDRLQEKLKDIRLMKQLFPNQVVIKSKPGQPKNSHIQLKR